MDLVLQRRRSNLDDERYCVVRQESASETLITLDEVLAL